MKDNVIAMARPGCVTISAQIGSRHHIMNTGVPQRAKRRLRSEPVLIETKFLRLFAPVEIGDWIDGWRVCWIGGWDKYRVVFHAMAKRVSPSKPASE
jgi:hypothetical protein